MPALLSINRGTTIIFSQSFLDVNGQPTDPGSASLTVNFPISKGRRSVVLPMTYNGTTYTASWESSVATRGTVKWSIKSGASPYSVTDGEFMLTANEANEPSIKQLVSQD